MLRRSADAERLAGGTSLTLILIGGASLLAGGLVSVVLTNHVLRPLAELQRTVGRLSRGDFDARAVVPGDHEIAALADQFNALARG